MEAFEDDYRRELEIGKSQLVGRLNSVSQISARFNEAAKVQMGLKPGTDQREQRPIKRKFNRTKGLPLNDNPEIYTQDSGGQSSNNIKGSQPTLSETQNLSLVNEAKLQELFVYLNADSTQKAQDSSNLEAETFNATQEIQIVTSRKLGVNRTYPDRKRTNKAIDKELFHQNKYLKALTKIRQHNSNFLGLKTLGKRQELLDYLNANKVQRDIDKEFPLEVPANSKLLQKQVLDWDWHANTFYDHLYKAAVSYIPSNDNAVFSPAFVLEILAAPGDDQQLLELLLQKSSGLKIPLSVLSNQQFNLCLLCSERTVGDHRKPHDVKHCENVDYRTYPFFKVCSNFICLLCFYTTKSLGGIANHYAAHNKNDLALFGLTQERLLRSTLKKPDIVINDLLDQQKAIPSWLNASNPGKFIKKLVIVKPCQQSLDKIGNLIQVNEAQLALQNKSLSSLSISSSQLWIHLRTIKHDEDLRLHWAQIFTQGPRWLKHAIQSHSQVIVGCHDQHVVIHYSARSISLIPGGFFAIVLGMVAMAETAKWCQDHYKRQHRRLKIIALREDVVGGSFEIKLLARTVPIVAFLTFQDRAGFSAGGPNQRYPFKDYQKIGKWLTRLTLSGIVTGWCFADLWKPAQWAIVASMRPVNFLVFTGWHTVYRLVDITKHKAIEFSTKGYADMKFQMSLKTAYIQQSAYFFMLGCAERYGGRHPLFETNTGRGTLFIVREGLLTTLKETMKTQNIKPNRYELVLELYATEGLPSKQLGEKIRREPDKLLNLQRSLWTRIMRCRNLYDERPQTLPWQGYHLQFPRPFKRPSDFENFRKYYDLTDDQTLKKRIIFTQNAKMLRIEEVNLKPKGEFDDRREELLLPRII